LQGRQVLVVREGGPTAPGEGILSGGDPNGAAGGGHAARLSRIPAALLPALRREGQVAPGAGTPSRAVRSSVTPNHTRYRSIFCSFIWPRHPGHSGGEIRDFHLLRHLLTQSEVEAFALHDTCSDRQQDPLATRVRALHTPET